MMKLLVFSGAGSPHDKRYKNVYDLISTEAKKRFGYSQVDMLGWPGQVGFNGRPGRDCLEHEKRLTLDGALEVATQKVAAWEQAGDDYHILCRSFGTWVGLKLAVDIRPKYLKKMILWGVPPYWVAWKYGVRDLDAFKQTSAEKGVYIDQTFFASLQPAEALFELVKVPTIIASGEEDIYCPPAFLAYLKEMFSSNRCLSFRDCVKKAPHEVVRGEVEETVVSEYLEVLFT